VISRANTPNVAARPLEDGVSGDLRPRLSSDVAARLTNGKVKMRRARDRGDPSIGVAARLTNGKIVMWRAWNDGNPTSADF